MNAPDPSTMAAGAVALQLPLSGSHLIEASAGTGKTWTLSALFVRLVVEGDLTVDQVLAVTFTRAATAELRQRIRRRLSDLLLALCGASKDALSEYLLQGDVARVERRARAALAAFDSAPIYTIHGFAQRALSERAFSAGVPFDIELGETRATWELAVRDFWRNHVAAWRVEDGLDEATHAHFVAKLIENRESPERWLAWLLNTRGAVGARIEANTAFRAARVLDLTDQRSRLVLMWQASKDEIQTILLTHPSLKRQSYSKGHVPTWCAETERFLLSGVLRPPAKGVTFLTTTAMTTRVKPGHAVPDHPFFADLDAFVLGLNALERNFIAWRQRLLLQVYEEVPPVVAARLAKLRVLGFDDLLQHLDDALHGARGDSFAAALKARFPAALIDEFQDTDAIQARIFSRIYRDSPESPVYLVGDPKQAIYRFRGADVYTYLSAAKKASARHALDENHRAVPGLVSAINHLFARDDAVFVHPDIRYRAAFAAKRERIALIDDGEIDPSPLRFMVPDTVSPPQVPPDSEVTAAEGVAAEIALMLKKARDGRLMLGERPLSGGDIAVLVKTNWQGQRIRRELRRYGIAVADRSRGSVYLSDEAMWLHLVLIAILEPHRAARVRNALATPLYGWSANDLFAVASIETGWQEVLEELSDFREAWQRGGVLRLLRELLARLPGTARLSASVEGERHLTNLFHLGELIQNLAGSGAAPLVQAEWLAKRIEYAREEIDFNEVAELHLESDQDLVQVLTLHKSKGLEFPVVFVPFLFGARAGKGAGAAGPGDMPLVYHDENDGDRTVIDFGSEAYGAARLLVEKEERSEDARLLYVGLTRAVHRCVVFWGESSLWHLAPIASLITGSARTPSAPPLDHALTRTYLAEIAAESHGALAVIDVTPSFADVREEASVIAPLAAQKLRWPLVTPWRLASFSSLQRKSRRYGATERPDHDQDAVAPDPLASSPPLTPRSDALRFRFPRGPAAGECLHRVLEMLPFGRDVDASRDAIALILKAHGFAARLAPGLAGWLSDIVTTPLFPGGFTLAKIDDASQIREMEFHLPLAAVRAGEIAPLARAHGLTLQALLPEQLDGFLKGFVDLVVRHEARFYVIDYKSNWLGEGFESYGQGALARAMEDGGYTLQYLLYSLALVRWLRFRDPEFDYERDFGGICYLFLRGMAPGVVDSDGASSGVFFARPPAALMTALDVLFGGGRA